MNKWKGIVEACAGKGMKKENMLVLVLLGVLLFIIALPTKQNNTEKSVLKDTKTEIIEKTEVTEKAQDDYAAYVEEKLEYTLALMEGVGKVKVMVTVSASQSEVVEKDRTTTRSNTTETDSEGGTRNVNNLESTETTLYTVDAYGNQVPYVTQLYEPEIDGVMVVAQGAGRQTVNSDITEAIQALFGIEAHKIKIAKMKTE